jgi:glycosyltransferase involved in cell wall biosynthesis
MFYGRVVVRHLARRQNRIVAISRNTADDIASFFGVRQECVSIIHNGIDRSRYFPGSREEACAFVARRYGLERPFFLYVPRLEHPAKNHVRLISAFEEFKGATHSQWQLVFGGSDWHGAEAIHAAIRQSPFAADIRCLGFVPDSDLPDLYRSAEIFVYPSLYEGFGPPPVEAMACGCPVMASTRGSPGEVVGEAAAIIDPEDFHTIARQLYILATDNALRNRLRAAGLAQAQKFDWRRTAWETLAAYEKVAGP